MDTRVLYLLEPGRSSFHQTIYEFSAGYRFILPGLTCPLCGTWATTGVAYPSIKDVVFNKFINKLGDGPLSVKEWQRILGRVRRFTGEQRVIEPGTAFGPLEGRFSGKIMPLMWLNPWTPLLSGKFLKKLQKDGIDVQAIPTKLKSKQRDDELWDLEIWPIAKLSTQDVNVCEVCGRIDCVVPTKIVLSGRCLHRTATLQRVIEAPTLIIVSKEFADAVKSMGAGDYAITPVTVRTERSDPTG